MSLVSDLITQAFIDITAIAPGGSITTTEQADAFLRLNQMIASWSTEGAMVFNQLSQSFNLSQGVTAYTLGPGGSFNTTFRAQKAVAWRATYANVITKGGPVLGLADFGASAQQADGETTPVPRVVGADTAYPLINVRVSPPPSVGGGILELDFWNPIAAFFSVNDTVSLPPGYEMAIVSNLAVELYNIYPRQGGMDPALAAKSQNSKAAIMAQNTTAQPQQQK